ncbi:hypothetical protein HOV93_04200 [Planctomycetes bacterium FF15]|uniref:Uncharacterized protein n=1 Tax=Bremerella alba TaxID=980252 RepID=A0A7V9A5V1_9BACT|nr:hypothetical protein [Bremerella alba]
MIGCQADDRLLIPTRTKWCVSIFGKALREALKRAHLKREIT